MMKNKTKTIKRRTPIAILHERKQSLQGKSDALTNTLEVNFNYLQNNLGALVTNTVIDSVTGKLPLGIQLLLGKSPVKDDSSKGTLSGSLVGMVAGLLGIVPFFMKGRKRLITSLLLKIVRSFL